MIAADEDIFYYLAIYNEPYPQPPMPENSEEAILKGLYLYRPASEERRRHAQLFGSGTIMMQVLRAQELLSEHHDVGADVWSATSYQQLRVEALEVERWNRLHPEEAARQPYVTTALESKEGPVIATSDSIKATVDQIARWVPNRFVALGTDGFGRSDSREQLRRHFEVDAEHIVVAALSALAQSGDAKPEEVSEAIKRYEIDPARPSPFFS
jgi:pyruvate dehydrogenase E1 component